MRRDVSCLDVVYPCYTGGRLRRWGGGGTKDRTDACTTSALLLLLLLLLLPLLLLLLLLLLLVYYHYLLLPYLELVPLPIPRCQRGRTGCGRCCATHPCHHGFLLLALPAVLAAPVGI